MKLTRLAIRAENNNGNYYEGDIYVSFQQRCESINLAGAVVTSGRLRPAMAVFILSMQELFK